MTERDFWHEKAVEWLNAGNYGCEYATRHETGICPSVDRMYGAEFHASLQAKLDKYLPKRRVTIFGHRWATNRHGARSRALFCLRMATLCPGDDSKITTAREAWFYLARCWLQAKLGDQNRYRVETGDAFYKPCGVCTSVHELRARGRVSETLRDEMWQQLEENLPVEHPSGPFGYRWAMNRHGARSRTLFCLRMAGLSK